MSLDGPSPEPTAGSGIAYVDPSSGGRGAGGDAAPSEAGTRTPAEQSQAPAHELGAIEAVIGFARDGAGTVLRPEAAAVVATTFGFPLVLALLVLLFLLIQPRLDDHDPKLRRAPGSMADTLVAFEDDAR